MPDQDFNLGSGFGEAIGNYNEYQNGRIGRVAKENEAAEKMHINYSPTSNEMQINGPADFLKEKIEAAAKYDQISAIYMKQVQELEAQRAQIKAHPFANTLAQIAGSMAANDVNPITRGLGQAALRLNPSDAELQAREQVPLRGALETAEAKTRAATTTIAQMDAQARIAETERSHRATEKEKKEELKQKYTKDLSQEARLIAQKASGKAMSEEAFTALAKTHHITDPEDIHNAYIAHQEEAYVIRKGEETKKSDKEEVDAAKIKAQGKERRENQRLAFDLKKDYFGLTKQGKEDFAKFKAGLHQEEGLSLMTPKNKDKLADLLATEKYINRVSEILSKPEYASMAGFKTAALKDIPKYLKGADRIEFENLLAHETPRLLSFIVRGGTGGASIIRAQAGVKMLQALGISGTESPEAAFRIMKNINNTISEGRLSIASETPKADYKSFADLFGKDAAEVQRRYAKYSNPSGDSGGTPSFDDYQKWKSGANR